MKIYITTIIAMLSLCSLSTSYAASTNWTDIIYVEAARDGRFFIRVDNNEDANNCGANEAWYMLSSTDTATDAGKNIVSLAYMAFAAKKEIKLTSNSCSGSYNVIDFIRTQ